MSEQTEFPLQETHHPQAPENDGAPTFAGDPPVAPKPRRAPRKATAKTETVVVSAGEKIVEDSDKPKKRVTRRTKKVEIVLEDAGCVPPAAGASNTEAGEPVKPRKRTVRKKKVDEADGSEPAPGSEGSGPGAAHGEHSQQLLQQPETSEQHGSTAEQQGSEEPGAAQPAPAQQGTPPQEQDSWEGKRGRRFRNRRRGRDRFQRREDFQGNGEGPHGPDATQNQPDENAEPVFEEGLVDVSGKGFGFLRKADVNYDPSNTDTFITPEVVRAHNLRDGMRIKGQIRMGHRGPQLFKLVELEGEDPEPHKNLPVFEELTVLNPLERIRLETTPNRFTTRVVDLMAPIGKGTRGLLVAPPRTGKTTILQHIAEALAINHPDIKVIMLLVDERPEEVTELRRALPHAEVIASSNDSDIKSHTRIAQLGIDRAKRLVEMGKDVFVLMDSITRIGRAFNNAQSGKGRTMSGGVDSRALEIPRKLFAAARNTEEAGSLTIIGTALVETGSKMDELIFLEFKGTGNMELVLDRKISDQRIYPAADIFMSGTRREELLIPADSLHKINIIRRGLAGHKPFEAIERLLFFLQKYPTNEEMLAGIPG
jgi:transcription termination factor Rho